MKLVKFTLAGIVIITLIFSACKKKTYDTDGISKGSLQDTSGICLPKNVSGTYQKDSFLILYNYIDVYVKVDTVGSYTIKTDSVNGYSFKGAGTFGKRGTNLVRLYGTGRPVEPGVNTFTVKYGLSYCTVDVYVGGVPTPPAVFTLDTTGIVSGACPGAVINGNYNDTTALKSSNTVSLKVNVITPGKFTIASDYVNGMSFSATGRFRSAGVQTVILPGFGFPSASGTYNLTVTTGTVSCTFSVTVN